MWTGWLPWRPVLSRIARALKFPDPVALFARLEGLARPSEVKAPVELLRAGAALHARGLVNAGAIQYNLDWAWPYWVERQYDPRGESFLPRAFSLTHINLTHRNWTAVGLPGIDRHPIVDPRGLVTPRYDGWSLDAWLLPDDGDPLLPARAGEARQALLPGPAEDLPVRLAVETRTEGRAGTLVERVETVCEGEPFLDIRIRAAGSGPGNLGLALRPANPEGISFVDRVERTGPATIRVNDDAEIRFARPPDAVFMSRFRDGDVLHQVSGTGSGDAGGTRVAEAEQVECPAGLATAVALFRLDEEGQAEITARVPLATGSDSEPGAAVVGSTAPGARRLRMREGEARDPGGGEAASTGERWRVALDGAAGLNVPEKRFVELWDAALRSLVLHSPGDVYPGPFTYKRFWFRDAAFIVDALCSAGLAGRARAALARYPDRQDRSGYFRSQDGEWDSNGAALWSLDRYLRLTGDDLPDAWIAMVRRGARWVARKRLDPGLDEPHAGLLPPGFSAEHLGPNDYYYWDDFWCAAGLRAAARILGHTGDERAERRWDSEATELLASVERSIALSPGHRRAGAVPASPYRRLDAGAVGSLCASYPLRLWSPTDPRLLATLEHLLENHMLEGGFFQDMIHSGINPYLTLHIGQALLRAGDPRQERLVRAVAGLASSTGQWPEAVHPRTGGGCMGDGQHAWASAEWVLMMRSWFVREESDRLILASGIPPGWLRSGGTAELGPAPTPFGPLTVRVRGEEPGAVVEWSAEWRAEPPGLDVRLPGHQPVTAAPGASGVRLDRR